MKIEREQFKLICGFNYDVLYQLKQNLKKGTWSNHDSGYVDYLYKHREETCRNEILVECNVEREIQAVIEYLDKRISYYDRILDEISFSLLNEIDIRFEIGLDDKIDTDSFESEMKMILSRYYANNSEKWDNWLRIRQAKEEDEIKYLGIENLKRHRFLPDIDDVWGKCEEDFHPFQLNEELFEIARKETIVEEEEDELEDNRLESHE